MNPVLTGPLSNINKAIFLLGIGLATTAPQTRAQSGVPLWTNRYSGSPGGYDQPNALAADSSGNVIGSSFRLRFEPFLIAGGAATKGLGFCS